MSSRKSQGSLFPVKREPVGMAEKAAQKDLRELRALDMLTTGTEALQVAYKRSARLVDRAERAADTWAATAAMRELRAIRLELAPLASPLAGDGLTDLLESITDIVTADREERAS